MCMQKLFAAIGLVAVLAVLGGAAYKVVGPTPAAPARKGVAKSISELSINRHFQVCIPPAGLIGGNGTTPQFSTTLPPNAGLAISSLDYAGGVPDRYTAIKIDGVQVWRGSVQQSGFQRAASRPVFTPPIIVAPGSILEIGIVSSNTSNTIELCISGYTLTLADFGL